MPESGGGQTIEENLWLACRLCNSHKSDRQRVVDPVSGQSVRLFNPRTDGWEEHFRWIAEGVLIEGVTATGRATVKALKLNRPELIVARRTWIKHGLHPPET